MVVVLSGEKGGEERRKRDSSIEHRRRRSRRRRLQRSLPLTLSTSTFTLRSFFLPTPNQPPPPPPSPGPRPPAPPHPAQAVLARPLQAHHGTFGAGHAHELKIKTCRDPDDGQHERRREPAEGSGFRPRVRAGLQFERCRRSFAIRRPLRRRVRGQRRQDDSARRAPCPVRRQAGW